MKTFEIMHKGAAYEVKVDDTDYDFVRRYTWHVQRGGRNLYAVRVVQLSRPRKLKSFPLHRELIREIPHGMVVDHINGDGLDNRRCNLRIATLAQNTHNQRLSIRNKSGFKGVNYFKARGTWRASICINNKQINLGCFDSAIKAARAYDEAAKKYFGEFAKTNF